MVFIKLPLSRNKDEKLLKNPRNLSLIRGSNPMSLSEDEQKWAEEICVPLLLKNRSDTQ